MTGVSSVVVRSLLQRVHNPRNRECACDSDCWCRRTALGRAVKWWFPGRYFGLHHKNRALEEWKRSQDSGTLAEWKRRQQEG
ncbi:MAG: hypothetical protein V7645_1510 [Actinomycetota bacterium]|jgi:hypothetical protein